jgi:HEPN domain-containing protein
MANPAQEWAERARYDLETARAMRESGRYLYVFFCCQQAL